MIMYMGFACSACCHDAGGDLMVSRSIPGDLPTFLALASCYLLASEGVSVLVANFVKSQQVAMLIVILVFLCRAFSWPG